MAYLLVKGSLYLEQDSFGAGLRWGALKHATQFSRRQAFGHLRNLRKFEPGVNLQYIATPVTVTPKPPTRTWRQPREWKK